MAEVVVGAAVVGAAVVGAAVVGAVVVGDAVVRATFVVVHVQGKYNVMRFVRTNI